MPAWYDIRSTKINEHEDREGVEDSSLQLQHIIQDQIAQGILPQYIVLAGFSQGGAIVLHTLVNFNSPLAGVLALSSYLPLFSIHGNNRSVMDTEIPLFLGHGNHDSIVPITLGEQSRTRLESLGFKIDWHEYPIEHSVSAEEIDDISRWLESAFNKVINK